MGSALSPIAIKATSIAPQMPIFALTMDERFLLTVTYKGEVLKYDAELRNYGYVHRVSVDIDGVPVQFEHDEEGYYRALVSPEQVNSKDNDLEVGLLQAIAQKLEQIHQAE
ncbi:hypothetical protein LLH06_19085 [Mucilaginibacter daejeonensis]|uniref:hypothetical protein n=1 Tax=Mucilaginibacter daejeonensis TaxID=398049 RepID=UPI001D17A171|nr:hypothetical protein [Mucilaginibacter daejeonensis]UEG53053.1 hypothetical protein LLH06_19085 [Mucilaginibacter daejeonensis]